MAILKYSGHQQDFGDIGPVTSGETLGVTGQSKRLEGLKVWLDELNGQDLNVFLRGNQQDVGWLEPVYNGALCGSIGQGKRLEAVQIQLTGADAEKYDIHYQVHAENIGWTNWAKNGELCGSEGGGLRIEAIRIVLTPKGIDLNVDNPNKYIKFEPKPVVPVTPAAPTGKFGSNEFKCECGCGGDVCQEIKDLANRVREMYGYPLVISSGFRCYDQNERDGGIPGSNHTLGQAADMYSPGRMSYDEVDRLAECIIACGGGVIRYHEQLFCHMELSNADWSMN